MSSPVNKEASPSSSSRIVSKQRTPSAIWTAAACAAAPCLSPSRRTIAKLPRKCAGSIPRLAAARAAIVGRAREATVGPDRDRDAVGRIRDVADRHRMIAADRTHDAAAREAGMNAARTVVMINLFVGTHAMQRGSFERVRFCRKQGDYAKNTRECESFFTQTRSMHKLGSFGSQAATSSKQSFSIVHLLCTHPQTHHSTRIVRLLLKHPQCTMPSA